MCYDGRFIALVGVGSCSGVCVCAEMQFLGNIFFESVKVMYEEFDKNL